MYYLYRIAQFFSLHLPRCCSYFIATCAAWVKFYLIRGDRQAVIYNLLPIVKDKKLTVRYARSVFENFAFYLTDFFSLKRLDDAFFKKYLTVEGAHFLDEALKGHGVIVLSAHIGNYELGASCTARLGYDLSVVALPHADRRINDFFNYQRSIFGVSVIPTGIGVRRCLRALKSKKPVAFLADRDFAANKGKVMTICGRKALLPKGPAYFALKTHSLLVPCFLVRENKYYYKLIYTKAISPYNGSVAKSEEEIMQEYVLVLEHYIKKYPQQWYMFYKYWLEE